MLKAERPQVGRRRRPAHARRLQRVRLVARLLARVRRRRLHLQKQTAPPWRQGRGRQLFQSAERRRPRHPPKVLAARAASAPPTSCGNSTTMDYGQFDSLAAAIEYGHEIGLKIHAWATINEDDHGWGWPSEFTQGPPRIPLGPPRRQAVSLAAQLRVPRSPRVQARADRRAAHELRHRRPVPRLDSHRRRPRQPADRRRPASPTAATKRRTSTRSKQKYNVDPHDVPNDDDRWVRLARRAANAVHARRPRARRQTSASRSRSP